MTSAFYIGFRQLTNLLTFNLYCLLFELVAVDKYIVWFLGWVRRCWSWGTCLLVWSSPSWPVFLCFIDELSCLFFIVHFLFICLDQMMINNYKILFRLYHLSYNHKYSTTNYKFFTFYQILKKDKFFIHIKIKFKTNLKANFITIFIII